MTHRFSQRLIAYALGPGLALTVPLSTVAGPGRSLNAFVGHHFARQAQRGWMAPDANPYHSWLYVTGNANNTVAIYDVQKRNLPKIGTITQGISSPGGMSVDDTGAVYVANESGSVAIYAPGSTSPRLTLTLGLQSPQGVSVDAAGNVYVCNRGNNPSIVIYAPGQYAPSQVITNSLIQVPTQIAFDSAGDLFYSDNNTGVSEISAGSQQMVSLGLQRLQRTDGIAVDPLNGNLYVGTYGSDADAVRVYAPGGTDPLGTLKDSNGADSNAIGMVGHTEYVFEPDSGSDEVVVFKHNRYHPAFTVNVTAAHYPVGVAVKPAGLM